MGKKYLCSMAECDKLLEVEGGPFETDEEVDEAARQFILDQGDSFDIDLEDRLFWIEVNENGVPSGGLIYSTDL